MARGNAGWGTTLKEHSGQFNCHLSNNLRIGCCSRLKHSHVSPRNTQIPALTGLTKHIAMKSYGACWHSTTYSAKVVPGLVYCSPQNEFAFVCYIPSVRSADAVQQVIASRRIGRTVPMSAERRTRL
jgi:hypothetical protein